MGFYKLQRFLLLTGPDAWRRFVIITTAVAGHEFAGERIFDRGTCGTDINAGSASDAALLVRDNRPVIELDARIHGAGFDAERIFTSLTKHRNTELCFLKFLDPNPGELGVFNPKVVSGTDLHALAATVALVDVDEEYFFRFQDLSAACQ